MMSNFNVVGKVKVEVLDDNGVVDTYEKSNLVVRQGRTNLLKILNGKLSYDNSYVIMDPAAGLFPFTTPRGYWVTYPAVGLTYNATNYVFYIGIEYDVYGQVIGSDSIIYDVPGLVTKLNTLFNSFSNKVIYNSSGEQIGVSSAGMGLFEASVVLKDNGEQTIKIKCTNNAPGAMLTPYVFGTGVPPNPYGGPAPPVQGVCSVDDFFGPNTVIYQYTSSVTCGNFVISTIQLGTGNVPASVDSNSFPADTYVSPSYPVTAVDIVDPAYPEFVTSCNYVAVIPKDQANGAGGTGVTFTEAALKHLNDDWFAHVNLGQQYKNNTFGLRLTWTINLLPQ
jgi:hypothetical protein